MVRKLEIMTPSEPSASFRSSSNEGHGMEPSQLIDVALAPMCEVHRQAEVRATPTTAGPVPIRQVGEPLVLRIGIGVDAPQSERVCTRDFGHRGVDVPPRQDRHRVQAPAGLLLELGHSRRCRSWRRAT
jgi:hypothetical protein